MAAWGCCVRTYYSFFTSGPLLSWLVTPLSSGDILTFFLSSQLIKYHLFLVTLESSSSPSPQWQALIISYLDLHDAHLSGFSGPSNFFI